MGEAQRRRLLDPNFGSTPKALQSFFCNSSDIQQKARPMELIFLGDTDDSGKVIIEEMQEITQRLTTHEAQGDKFLRLKIGDKSFLEACKESPELFLIWFELVVFSQKLETSVVTRQQATRFWEEYWTNAIPILGRCNLKDSQTRS